MKTKKGDKVYLQYKSENGDLIPIIFRNEESANDFIHKNNICNITYKSHKPFPFREHNSSRGIKSFINFYGSNSTTKRYLGGH